jgi:Protein of unknown function (DUF732)
LVWVSTHHQPAVSPTPVAAPAPAPTVVTVQAPPPSTVTVQAAPPPTVTVQATPSTTTVIPDQPPEPTATHLAAPVPSFQPTVPILAAEDQAFLARQRADGWVIYDDQQMLRTAHLVCLKFRQGESAEQVNQELASMPGPNSMQMALQFSSNVLLSYSEC